MIFLFFQISFNELKILEKEQKVIKSLINHLKVRRCLIINEFEHFATLTKDLSKDYVFTSVFDIEELAGYIIPDEGWPWLIKDRDFPTKTAVIWKIDFHEFRFNFSVSNASNYKFFANLNSSAIGVDYFQSLPPDIEALPILTQRRSTIG